MATTAPAPYYDPYDFDIDADPYPVWKQPRDEAPLYFNEKYGFYALSRYADVERSFVDWETYSSAKGSVMEIIKANIELPPGMFIFEDPPDHDLHRGLLSRVFTPGDWPRSSRRSGTSRHGRWTRSPGRGASTSSPTSARTSRCARSACCWASPKRTSKRCGTRLTRGSASTRATCPFPHVATVDLGDFRVSRHTSTGGPNNPSDDLMTELLTAEFTDATAPCARSPRRDPRLPRPCWRAPATRRRLG